MRLQAHCLNLYKNVGIQHLGWIWKEKNQNFYRKKGNPGTIMRTRALQDGMSWPHVWTSHFCSLVSLLCELELRQSCFCLVGFQNQVLPEPADTHLCLYRWCDVNAVSVRVTHAEGATAPAQHPYSNRPPPPPDFPSSVSTTHELTTEKWQHVILLKHKILIMQMRPGSWLINGSYQDKAYLYTFINTVLIFFSFLNLLSVFTCFILICQFKSICLTFFL